MAYIVPLEIPNCCFECPFLAPFEEIPVEAGLYKKVTYCMVAPKEIENIYRNSFWLVNNDKEEWCPLKELKEMVGEQNV